MAFDTVKTREKLVITLRAQIGIAAIAVTLTGAFGMIVTIAAKWEGNYRRTTAALAIGTKNLEASEAMRMSIEAIYEEVKKTKADVRQLAESDIPPELKIGRQISELQSEMENLKELMSESTNLIGTVRSFLDAPERSLSVELLRKDLEVAIRASEGDLKSTNTEVKMLDSKLSLVSMVSYGTFAILVAVVLAILGLVGLQFKRNVSQGKAEETEKVE